MAIYIEVNNIQYPAVITGKLNDRDWDNRASKAITLEMAYADAMNIFVNDVKWSIMQDAEQLVIKENENGEKVFDENGEIVYETVMSKETFDNSEYSMAGDIIDHRNGTVTVKMGKPTAEEKLEALMKQMSL